MIEAKFDLKYEMSEHSKALLLECQRVVGLGLEFVSLKLPSRPVRGERIRIAGKGSPFGYLANATDTHLVVHAKALDVMAWLLAVHGARKVEP